VSAYKCRTCGQEGDEHFYKTAKYQCKSCWNKRTAQSGKDKVQQLKTEAGGRCSRCGYDRCMDALEFHHTDPTQKEFHLGEARGLNIDKLRAELSKCLLVCRNCHTELHAAMK
jgi:DNA-directed RNA polymerase subunit RPC12/RpoP